MRSILLILLLSFNAHADIDVEDIDVDWPPSAEPGVHTLRIVVGGCKTIFKIKDKDLKAATSDDEAITKALAAAIERSGRGCKN